MFNRIKKLFSRPIDPEKLEDLEQTLFEADLGSNLVLEFTDVIESNKKRTKEEILDKLKDCGRDLLTNPPKVQAKEGQPQVILIVGVNGSGKTTTIAKLAKRFANQGKRVLLAAGDTFRAAAVEQLTHWAENLHIPIVRGTLGGDSSSVIYDAISKAKAQEFDIVLCDTAGRLESKDDLMKELEKIHRVCDKVVPGAPHQTLLVVDANIGQTAIEQARIFHKHAPLTGIILSKLDSSAKGGIVLPIYQQMGIPIEWVGLGEGPDDLIPFDLEAYLAQLFSP